MAVEVPLSPLNRAVAQPTTPVPHARNAPKAMVDHIHWSAFTWANAGRAELCATAIPNVAIVTLANASYVFVMSKRKSERSQFHVFSLV
jgi:hypothetical protein